MKTIIIYVTAFVFVIILTKLIFEGVMASDMPDWVKYMILG